MTARTVVFSLMLMAGAAPLALADDLPTTKAQGSSGVAQMLQRRQETQLRQQLLREGRTDEIHQLDESVARRDRERKAAVVERLNQAIAQTTRGNAGSTFIDTSADACDRESSRLSRTAVR